VRRADRSPGFSRKSGFIANQGRYERSSNRTAAAVVNLVLFEYLQRLQCFECEDASFDSVVVIVAPLSMRLAAACISFPLHTASRVT